MKLLKEPLVQFALLGAILFAAYAWLHRADAPVGDAPPAPIRLGESDVRWIRETWARQWGREPTDEEMRGLVGAFLEEHAMAREAARMGLDDDDMIVRRRLAQKLQFLIQDVARVADPSDDELRRFLESHADLFGIPPTVTFTHILFKNLGRADAQADAAAALAMLRGPAPRPAPAELGDPMLMDADFIDATPQTVGDAFGPEFSRAVFDAPRGEWSGPFQSAYGLHLVLIRSTTPAATASFETVRDAVLERYRDDRAREAYRRFVAELLQRQGVDADESVRRWLPPDLTPAAPERPE